MRKRIVIGLLALVVIGVVVFLVAQPKKGSVEWHKRQYRTVYGEMAKGTMWARTRNAVYRIFGKQGYVGLEPTRLQRFNDHQQALIQLGYLERQEFVLSNRSVDYVIHESSRFIRDDPRWKRAQKEFIYNSVPRTNVLAVIAARDDMPIFVEAVRKADVP